jgi:adenylate cyclase
MTRLRDLVRAQPKRGIKLPAWLDRITSIGIVTTNPEVARRQRFTNVGAYASAANAASHFVINLAYAPRALLIIHVYNALFTIAALCVHRFHRFGDNAGATFLVAIVVGGNLFVVWMLGSNSDLHVYFTLTGAILFMFGVEHWRQYIWWCLAAAAALLISIYLVPANGLVMVEDSALREMLSGHALMNTIIINGLVIFYALTTLRRAEIELDHQYARSEALITTVMPASIAQRLKSGSEQRIADRIDNLSVLFADLVSFTTAAHGQTPEVVVDFLDDLVCSFDELCEAHGVEKIKTIGDSYMAVAGLGGEGAAGAVAIGRVALAMLATNALRPPLGEHRLDLRLGIHCGPATAGVIGETRISYDVWGDAVNMASRMESHGVPGRIQVSEEFHALTEGAFVYEERGATELRGIGVARTFFLVGEKQ